MVAVLRSEVTNAAPDAIDVDGARRTRPWQTMALHGVALLLFSILTLTRLWPLVLHPTRTVTPDLIDPVYNVWAVASSLHNLATWPDGPWSPFHANIFYPTPHAAAYGDVFLGLLPVSWPLHYLIGDPVALVNALNILSFVASAYALFLLGYELTGSYAGALAAGLVFGFCPLRTEHIGHLTVLSTEWLGAAAYCLVRAWRGGRWPWWVAMGLFVGLSAITNLYYLAYLTAPLLLVAVLYWRSWTLRVLGRALLAAGVGMVIIVPFVLPYLGRQATLGQDYGTAANIDVLSFLSATPGQPIDGGLLPTVPVMLMQPAHALFPGFVALVMAVVAWKRRLGRPWAIFALACAALALGPQLQIGRRVLPIPLPYAWLTALVPHFSVFRAPEQATMGLSLGLAIVCAYGARELLGQVRRGWRRYAFGAALVGVLALESWAPVPMATLAAIPAGERWLARQPHIHAIVELPLGDQTPLDWQRQSEIMYDSTAHWKDEINGAASVLPTGTAQRDATLSTYPSDGSLRLLRALRVDAVVLRLAWLTPRQRVLAARACHTAFQDATERICVGPWTPDRR